MRFLDRLDSSGFAVERVAVADEHRAIDIIRQYDDKKFSYTDATSFSIMERLGIEHAFTFDHNFTQYGFRQLEPG
jgi:predicted nucleic acid-binding protein